MEIFGLPWVPKAGLMMNSGQISMKQRLSEMAKIQRKKGFYWVRYISVWHVAEWNGNFWKITGATEELDDSFWSKIDEKEITRE
jgi:hypothetical protein